MQAPIKNSLFSTSLDPMIAVEAFSFKSSRTKLAIVQVICSCCQDLVLRDARQNALHFDFLSLRLVRKLHGLRQTCLCVHGHRRSLMMQETMCETCEMCKLRSQ